MAVWITTEGAEPGGESRRGKRFGKETQAIREPTDLSRPNARRREGTADNYGERRREGTYPPRAKPELAERGAMRGADNYGERWREGTADNYGEPRESLGVQWWGRIGIIVDHFRFYGCGIVM